MVTISNLAEVTSLEKTEQNLQQLDSLLDEELVELVHQGNTEALDFLITKYRSFVRMKGRSYFLIGADKEDILQEGMIGLYKAIRDFKEEKLGFFSCICRVMYY